MQQGSLSAKVWQPGNLSPAKSQLQATGVSAFGAANMQLPFSSRGHRLPASRLLGAAPALSKRNARGKEALPPCMQIDMLRDSQRRLARWA